MNTMNYKGYLGSVAFSEQDGVFYGKVEGINGLVNFEGESVKELTRHFMRLWTITSLIAPMRASNRIRVIRVP